MQRRTFLQLLGALAPAAEPMEMAARAATQRYRDAWLANDAEAVMAALTGDAVLMPSSMKPIVGERAIRAFWFPSRRAMADRSSRVERLEVRTLAHVVAGRKATYQAPMTLVPARRAEI